MLAYWSMTQEEFSKQQGLWAAIMDSLHQQMGESINIADLEEVGLPDTLQCDPYVNSNQTGERFSSLQEELEPTLDEGDKYITAEIMLP